MTFRDVLAQCSPIPLSERQFKDLERHFELLVHWNQALNLTRIDSPEEAARLHYCESIQLAQQLPGSSSVADVGSGAGFPGIPIAITRPDLQVTLIESHQRKAVFLREASRGLVNISVEPCRAQLLSRRFDWMVSRAVDPAELAKLDLAPHLALLMSSGDLQRMPTPPSHVLPMAGAKNRVIAMFHVKHDKIDKRG